MSISEKVEEYLEALWISEESGEKIAHITWVAKHLGISAPSAVEMLRKLEKEGFVIYETRQGIQLTDKGRAIARRIIRGHRLIEVLMKETLRRMFESKWYVGWNIIWMRNSWMLCAIF